MRNKVVRLSFKLVILGVIVGLFIAGFQYLIHEVTALGTYIFTSNNSLLIGVFLVIAIIISFILIFINNKDKGYLGSGIPQYESYYEGNLNLSPVRMFLHVLFQSLYAYFCGFPFGGEGPSITLAASISHIYNKIFKKEDKEVVAGAASAGFACAFLAPLAGICHLIEENKKMFSWTFFLKGLVIILIAFVVSYFVYPHNLLPIKALNFIDYKYYYIFIVISIMAFVVARLYVFMIIKVKDLSKKMKYFLYLTPFFVLLFLYYKTRDPYMIGSGSDILNDPLFTSSIILLIFYLIYRILGTAFSNSLVVSGGLVLPMLTLGVICGSITTILFEDIIPNIRLYNSLFCIVGMIVVFSSVCNTPLTGFCLGLKMGKPLVVVLPILIALVLSTSLSYLFKQKSVYKLLEKRLLN